MTHRHTPRGAYRHGVTENMLRQSLPRPPDPSLDAPDVSRAQGNSAQSPCNRSTSPKGKATGSEAPKIRNSLRKASTLADQPQHALSWKGDAAVASSRNPHWNAGPDRGGPRHGSDAVSHRRTDLPNGRQPPEPNGTDRRPAAPSPRSHCGSPLRVVVNSRANHSSTTSPN